MSEFKKQAEPGRKQSTGWPSYRYGPNGESRVFEREEDVPGGWHDHPSKVLKDDDEPNVAPVIPMSRKEIVADLKALGVPYERSAPTAKLYEALKEAVNTEAE